MGRLQGRRVVITGASSGIGLAAARLFAREGASLVLLARSQSGLAEAVRAAGEEGAEAHALTVDVADRPAIEAAVGEASERLGGIDVLVSNAGMAGFGPFAEIEPADFERTVEITFTGAVNAVRAALPHLERSGGTIVATVSIAAKVPVPLLSPYVAAKHALRGFLGSLRVELLGQGSKVKVAMVHPAPIDTPYYESASSAIDVQPKPLRSAYRTEVVAQTLVECAVRPRAEVVVGGSAKALDIATTVARPLSDLVLAAYAMRGQKSDIPARRPGALWEPSGDGRIRGVFGGRRSVWTALRMLSPRLLRLPRL